MAELSHREWARLVENIVPVLARVQTADALTEIDRRVTSSGETDPARLQKVSAKGNATFGRRCEGCPLRTRCTTNKSGRSLRVGAHDARLVAARAQATTPEFAAAY